MAQAQKRLGLLYNSFYFVIHTHSPNFDPSVQIQNKQPGAVSQTARAAIYVTYYTRFVSRVKR